MKEMVIELEGVSLRATLFEDKAPQGVSALWDSLPLSTELRHARRSGNAAYFVAPAMARDDMAVENQVSFCYPGSVCLLPDTGTFLLAYGQAQARNEDGNVWATHLGSVEGETSDFFGLLAETQRKGLKLITLRKAED